MLHVQAWFIFIPCLAVLFFFMVDLISHYSLWNYAMPSLNFLERISTAAFFQ